MNRLSDLEFIDIRPQGGFDVCWAGPNLVDLGGFCFGTTNGQILFSDLEGRLLRQPGKGSLSNEAINGMARAGNWIGITTREEVNFWPLDGTPGVVAPFGAHDITTTKDGYFIAPMGRNGIMVAPTPVDRGATVPKVYSSDDPDLYDYRLIVLGLRPGAQTIVCAARLGGIAAGDFVAGNKSMTLRTAGEPGFDAIDVCSLEPGTESRALVALGQDGTMFLFHDLTGNQKPFRMKFQRVHGVAYRVFCSRGDIYVLTSKGLFVLGQLGSRFLRSELTSDTTTPVRTTLLEAVDANLVDNRWLLVVMPDIVARYDLELIHQQALDHLDDPDIQERQPVDGSTLKWRDVTSTPKQLVPA